MVGNFPLKKTREKQGELNGPGRGIGRSWISLSKVIFSEHDEAKRMDLTQEVTTDSEADSDDDVSWLEAAC